MPHRQRTDLHDYKDWDTFDVSFKMRGRNLEHTKKIVQWAFDNYFLYESKVAHFESQTVKDLSVDYE